MRGFIEGKALADPSLNPPVGQAGMVMESMDRGYADQLLLDRQSLPPFVNSGKERILYG